MLNEEAVNLSACVGGGGGVAHAEDALLRFTPVKSCSKFNDEESNGSAAVVEDDREVECSGRTVVSEESKSKSSPNVRVLLSEESALFSFDR